MKYQITNLLHTSLTIEDIGVVLQSAGGKDSIKILPEQTYHSSRIIKKYERQKWVSTKIILDGPKKSIPVWPFSSTSEIVAPRRPPSSPPPPSPSAPNESFHHLETKLDKILDLLRMSSTPSAVRTAFIPSAVSAPSEPMFVPSKILPESAEVRINVKESEMDSSGMDEKIEALRKARRRK